MVNSGKCVGSENDGGVFGSDVRKVHLNSDIQFDTPKCNSQMDRSYGENDGNNYNINIDNNLNEPTKTFSYASMVKVDDIPKELDFIPAIFTEDGIEVVVFYEKIVKLGSKRWCLTICGQFVGYDMHINEFRDEIGLNAVIEKEPWMIRNKPLFIQKWSSEIGMQKVEPRKMPVWVKINNVPLEAWSVKEISALASGLGKPILMDTMIAKMCHKGIGSLEFARVLVEIDAAKDLKKEIEIQYIDKSNNIKGKVFEWGAIDGTKDQPADNPRDNVKECIEPQQERNAKFVEQGQWKNFQSQRQNFEDNEAELKMIKERMIVDKFLVAKIQPTVKESITWSKDMTEYFKVKWAEIKENEGNDTNDGSDIEDVIKINEGSASILKENVISAKFDFKCFYTFVYAANDGINRRKLWEELICENRFVDGKPWCLAGDLNVTLQPNEHSCGSLVRTSDMLEFQECLNNIEVEDICSSGLHYTWTKNLQITKAAKIKWLRDEDKNNNYFHKVLKGRNNKSKVFSLSDAYGQICGGDQIPKLFLKHFEEFLGNAQHVKEVEDCATLFQRRLGPDVAQKMIKDITEKEIKSAMFDINDSKAIGPNGFTAAFFKKASTIVGNDVQTERDPSFQYHYGCKQVKLVHVCFADDLLVMCHGDSKSIRVIQRALNEFSECCGLMPNNSKRDNAKGKAKVAWKDICRPKDQGGLRLKNLQTWNHALLAKHEKYNWSSLGPLSQLVTQRDLYDKRLSEDLKVIDMVCDGQWKWPNEWHEKFLEISILEVPNLDANDRDKLVWNNRNGQVKDFSVGLANQELYLWGKICILADFQENILVLENIIQSLSNAKNGNNIRSIIRRLLFNASIYNIWKERNGMILEIVKDLVKKFIKALWK
uniref:DUF4283 domain-containing protein n=1 Tax=Tanacetum cinerariifolium TaxID=118510 RepID=A0A6L2NHC3_TANCI|nr:hypothetical protein [Tanacetum cinerariifolium]